MTSITRMLSGVLAATVLRRSRSRPLPRAHIAREIGRWQPVIGSGRVKAD